MNSTGGLWSSPIDVALGQPILVALKRENHPNEESKLPKTSNSCRSDTWTFKKLTFRAFLSVSQAFLGCPGRDTCVVDYFHQKTLCGPPH
jgi:hypothetical protein